jgi:glycosyltransferase involved in cell wall biosynthesis
MRVALVLPGFSAHSEDWAIPALLKLALSLTSTCELHIFSQRYPARGIYHFSGLTHYALGGGQQFGLASLRLWLQTAQAVIRQHRQTPFDLIHAFWVDEAGFSAALAGRKLKRPVVASLIGGELTRLPEIGYGAQRFLARRLTTRYTLAQATQVTAGSAYQLDLCRAHGVPEHKLKLGFWGVDTSYFHPVEACPPAPPAVIQAASLLPVKNQALLLQTISQARRQLPELQLHLVGTGPDHEALVRLAQQLNLSGNITWHGQIPYLQMPTLYRQASFYLQTSHHEGQGMAVLEAMACGLPVIGTPVGVVRELACLPPQSEPEALAAQLVQLVEETEAYPARQQQARRQVETSFSQEAATANFLKIYESLRTYSKKLGGGVSPPTVGGDTPPPSKKG